MINRLCTLMRNILVVFLPLLVSPLLVQAGDVTMEVSPGTGTYVAGEDVTLQVFASTGGQPANAVEAQLSYDPNSATVTSISREGSLISSWTEEPTIDGDLGRISFGGILATSTPLDHDLLLVLHLRPLRTGDLRVHFEQGAAVHAADGTGGNMLTGFRDGQYLITPKDLSEATGSSSPEGEVLGAATATPAVTITSPTDPDQMAWYSASSSVFLFHVESGVTTLRLGFDAKEHGQARVVYSTPIAEKKVDNIDDGVWYLHLSAEGANAESFATDYRIQVDHTPPDNFTVNEVPRQDNADPNTSFTLTATDTLSGIDHYLIGVDGEEAVKWVPDETHEFHYHASPGVHVLHATVVDRAGNTLSVDRSFEVTYLPSPHLTLHDVSYSEGDSLRMLIDAPQNATLTIFLSRNGATPSSEKSTADDSGNANFVSQAALAPGTYQIWAVAGDGNGGVSKESEHVSVEVSASLWGLMTRHPFIPVALCALILLFVALARFLKTKHKKNQPDFAQKHPETPEIKHPHTPTAVRGRIVLQPRVRDTKPHLPPTRLQ